MATYYWVGGAGTWNSSTTTNWASSSGGAGGAGVPTSADDVIFNSASNATGYTVTIATGAVCLNFTANGPAAGTVAFSVGAILSVHGNLTFAATGVSVSGGSAITFAGSTAGNTITSNGVAFGNTGITITGTGSYSLGGAFTANGANSAIVQSAGTFSTNNYNISTWGGLAVTGGTINLGSSTITSVQFYGGFSFAAPGTATVNAGTSTLVILGYNGSVTGNGQTLYTVDFQGGSSTCFIETNFIATNLKIGGNGPFSFRGSATITGTFSTYNTTLPYNRTVIRSNTTTQRTITAAAVSLYNTDFSYINGAGAAAPFTGTNLSDLGNNSNITFTTPKTVYWNLAGSQNWKSTGWATTSGGTPNIANFPLIQDTAIIDNTGAAGTIAIDRYQSVGTIDASARTSACTISINQDIYIYGSVLYGTGITAASYVNTTFTPYQGSSISVNVPSNFAASATFTGFAASGQKVTLLNNFSTLAGMSFTNIGLDTGNYNISATALSFTSGTLDVNLGTSTVSLTGTGTVFTMTSANLSAASSTIALANTTNGTSQTFSGGGKTYGTLALNGGAATGQTKLITGSNTFSDITSNNTAAWQLRFSGGTTNNFNNWNISGSSGNLVTINTNPLSVAATLNYTGSTYVSFDYASVARINGRPANYKWFAGLNSTDAGNNTGIFFTAPFVPSSGNFLSFF